MTADDLTRIAVTGSAVRTAEEPLLAAGRGPELMRAAAWALAEHAAALLRERGPVAGTTVAALVGPGNNGGDGLAQAAQDAVLNANYIKARLQHVFSVPFGDYPTMHEALFDDSFLTGTGVTTLDFAKALIDEGFHPMTMYFPLVVHGAMLIEPTESESKASLDLFVMTLRDLAFAAKRGDVDRFSGAPYHAPRRRLDETRAARQPILRWTPPLPVQEAAE